MELTTGPQVKRDKYTELILYICRHSEGDESFGMTKLNKLLFYVDFSAKRAFRKAITNQEYQKLEHGPCPRSLKPVLDAMVADGLLFIRKDDHYGLRKKTPIAIAQPDVSHFSPEEIDLARNVIDRFRDYNATAISSLSHQFVGWELAEFGETIPYELAYLDEQPRELTLEEISYAGTLQAEAEQALADG